MIVTILKVLSHNYGPCTFIDKQQLIEIEKLVCSFRAELVFSNRYLCFKYILQMLTLYLKADEPSLLFQIIG